MMNSREFMEFASHELRTPLSVIALNLDILDRNYGGELDHPSVKEHLKVVRHAVDDMIELLKRLSQMQRGS